MTHRRDVLRNVGVLAAATGAGWLYASRPTAAAQNFEVMRSPAEWQALLTDPQFNVLRQAGTEPPFSSPLNAEQRKGIFGCAGCALPLFSSDNKFESGTGWPSFWAPIEGAVNEVAHGFLFFKQTEIVCHRCGSHIGHVFEDGPKPTGLRYCINGLALTFTPAPTTVNKEST